MTTMDISAATLDDLDVIMDLDAAGFQGCEQWGADSWESELSSPGLAVLAARDDRLRGLIALRIGPDVCDLDRIVVDPSSRRRGIGRRLMDAGLERAASRGVQEMILEVRSDNEPAIALYRSYGFAEITVRNDYYGPGRHALLMSRPITRSGR